MGAKIKLFVFSIIQLSLFGLFLYLMTTVNPTKNLAKAKAATRTAVATAAVVKASLRKGQHKLRASPRRVEGGVCNTTEPTTLRSAIRRKGLKESLSNATPLKVYAGPLHRHGGDTVALIRPQEGSNGVPAMWIGSGELCNTSACVYKLVSHDDAFSDGLDDNKRARVVPSVPVLSGDERKGDDGDEQGHYSAGKATDLGGNLDGLTSYNGKSIAVKEKRHNGGLLTTKQTANKVKGFRRSANDKERIDEDSVVLKFLGSDRDGAPMVEIRVGTNIQLAKSMGGDASVTNWLPYEHSTDSPALGNHKLLENETTPTVNDASSTMDSIKLKASGSAEEVENHINISSNFKYFEAVMQGLKQPIPTKVETELNMNSTSLRNGKVDKDLPVNFTRLQNNVDFALGDYETTVDRISRVSNKTGPILEPTLEVFFDDSVSGKTLQRSVQYSNDTEAEHCLVNDTRSNNTIW